MNVTVCNPLRRTPLSLIVDDSCPVINLTYYWMRQRREWKKKHDPSAPPDRWKLEAVPQTIPAEFANKWAGWCGEQGVRGKFSLIPFPGGVSRVDEGLDIFRRSEFDEWMRVYRDVLWKNFDLTPEMLTHTRVVDLRTWRMTDDWEQGKWVDPPVEPLTDYIAMAMELLRKVGIPCEGVTSPGDFGKKKEQAYARATLDAALRVNGNKRPFYFLWIVDGLPDVPIYHADVAKGVAVASIVGCTGDWFGGWTGFDAGSADKFITEDLRGGRLPEVLATERPCVLVGHWPGFYFGGQEVGFDVLKEVKRRLDAYDSDGTKTLWMKTSRIAHYWMARELSDVVAADGAIRVTTKFPTEDFTLCADGCAATRVQVGGADLRQVRSQRDFRSGTFLVEANATYIAFDLLPGMIQIDVT